MGLSITYVVAANHKLDARVSVPSRGNGVIDLFNLALVGSVSEFPSPLGEMGLSIADFGLDVDGWWTIRFPSPLGEMGLSIENVKDIEGFDPEVVSVPSRGNGVIDPLRRYGFCLLRLGFRPLSGKWGYRSLVTTS